MSLPTRDVLHSITIFPTGSESGVLTANCQLTGADDSDVCRRKHKNSLHLSLTLKVSSFFKISCQAALLEYLQRDRVKY